MTDLFPPWPLFSAFILASLVLTLTPGPCVLYILMRSLVHGRRPGLISVAGVAIGNLGNAVIASVGLAALFAVSSPAYWIFKYAGAGYLLYLGLRMFLTPADETATPLPQEVRSRRIFRDAFLVALLNPKTTLFFAAFLPQFLDPAGPPGWQSLRLGFLFVAIAAITDSAYAIAAGRLATIMGRSEGLRRLGRYLAGGVFIGLGLLAGFGLQ